MMSDCVRLKLAHPSWGPRKIRTIFGRAYPEAELASESTFKRVLDRAVGTGPIRSLRSEKVQVLPQQGRLVAMAANRCWHSVSGVQGERDRINVILAYDRRGASFAAEDGLDTYLYTNETSAQEDPNYLR